MKPSIPLPYGVHVEEALAKTRSRNEKIRLDTLEMALAALSDLRDKTEFTEAYIFGSLARPYCFTKESDIDIGIAGLADENFFTSMAFLSERLKIEVDLKQLESSPKLQEKVKKEGIRWNLKK